MDAHVVKTRLPGLAAIVLGTLLVAVPIARAQDASASSYDQNAYYDPDIRQTVARISTFDGDCSFSRGDDPDNWQAVDFNVPMTLGDRVYTGRGGRLELEVTGGSYVRLGPDTDLSSLNLTDDTEQFSLNAGVAAFQIGRLGRNEVIEIDTPNTAVTFEQTGEYRVFVDSEGNSRIGVIHGLATVAAGGGELTIHAGQQISIDGIDTPQYDFGPLPRPGPFDGWVGERERRFDRRSSARYVSPDVVGVEDLDDYGRWSPVPGYGMCWTPNSVETGWAPYTAGHWVWQDPWGWTWIAAEPWGWAPYHYGRWVVYDAQWYWVPTPVTVQRVSYAPALVAFVGGSRGGLSVGVGVGAGGGGMVGWFPLGPREPVNPWWGSHTSSGTNVNVNVTNVKYVNKTYVTVVNQNTFVSGGLVQRNVVRDQAIVRQVSAAPVERGPIAVAPTRESLRVSVRPAATPRPAGVITERAVVVKSAPPPAPPRFEEKLKTIEQNHGAPVTPQTAARIATDTRGGKPKARVAVQPVAEVQGEVRLNPKRQNAAEPPPQRVQPERGRALATQAKPVAPEAATAPPPAAPPSSTEPSQAPERGRGQGRGPERGREAQQAHPAPPPPAPNGGQKPPQPAPGNAQDKQHGKGQQKDKNKDEKGNRQQQDNNHDGTPDNRQQRDSNHDGTPDAGN